jgi:hypothetical protein
MRTDPTGFTTVKPTPTLGGLSPAQLITAIVEFLLREILASPTIMKMAGIAVVAVATIFHGSLGTILSSVLAASGIAGTAAVHVSNTHNE